MIYFYKIQLCVKKIAKRRKKNIFPPLFWHIFSQENSQKFIKSTEKRILWSQKWLFDHPPKDDLYLLHSLH